MNGPATLRKLLAKPGILLAPGAFCALAARMVEQAGFEAIYASGAGVANSLLGEPDIGLVTMTEMLEQVRRMVAVTTVPLIVDVDTGYGNPINVYRTVREFEAVGAAAVQIEDQLMPKRCGHFEGKQLIPAGEMVAKLRAAQDARRNSDLVIIARTDARATLGVEAALERARLYLETGADLTFVEAPLSEEELRLVAALPGPQVANMVEDGKTPLLTAADLAALGFKLVIFPNTALRAAMRAMADVLERLRTEGGSAGFLDRLVSMAERNRITGMPTIEAMQTRYGSAGAQGPQKGEQRS
ncbi:MAG: isocitrate lyase/phosphoenolpyruvate mutase family protein [Acidobacteria bacterium]|nr:isocitrate lyase/phosphoenolpyruvate mutase family protein [Acidobacteriota bacterium]